MFLLFEGFKGNRCEPEFPLYKEIVPLKYVYSPFTQSSIVHTRQLTWIRFVISMNTKFFFCNLEINLGNRRNSEYFPW